MSKSIATVFKLIFQLIGSYEVLSFQMLTLWTALNNQNATDNIKEVFRGYQRQLHVLFFNSLH